MGARKKAPRECPSIILLLPIGDVTNCQGKDVAKSVRQRIGKPMLSAVRRAENLTDLAAAEYVIRLVRIHRETENSRFQRQAKVCLLPSVSSVMADEECSSVAVEIIAGGQVQSLAATWSKGQDTTIGANRAK